jgi:hypothetical protein
MKKLLKWILDKIESYKKKKRFKKDDVFDARMVIAIRNALTHVFAEKNNMSIKEVFDRQDWLEKQSRQYRHSVDMSIKELEIQNLMNQLP